MKEYEDVDKEKIHIAPLLFSDRETASGFDQKYGNI